MAQPALADMPMMPAAAASEAGSLNLVYAILRVIAHHWWKILAIWAVLTAGLVYLIFTQVRPMYETSSLLRVEPSNRDLFNLGLNSSEVFDHFLQTQVQLMTSPNVLTGALNSKAVSETAIVREAGEDAESVLKGKLAAGVVPGTYLIKVSLTLPDPKEAATIVNEVVRVYLEVAGDWSTNKNKYQIDSLQEYNRVLSAKVKERQDAWLALAGKGNVDLVEVPAAAAGGGSTLPQAMPSKVSVSEYQQAREQLFRTNMDLIEAEALYNTRKAEIAARGAGVDPDTLLTKRVDDALRKDPEILGLIPRVEQARQRIAEVAYTVRSKYDPARRTVERSTRLLEEQYFQLLEQKREELTNQFREEGTENPMTALHGLAEQIDAMKVRKASYENLLRKIEVSNREQGTDAVQVALVRDDYTTLKEMLISVEKRIEQLQFDARGEARINQISQARENGSPISDSRKKYLMMTPVGVLGVVLGLFLFMELRSGRVADLDDFSRRIPVEVYAVPSLPGTRRTSDQRALRANEAQLQEFLQSLDHLRVSLWFGKEAVPGMGRCLAVTSAIGGEGKTTLTAHLAVCCAKAGISTLVIDADLRRASLSRMFEEERTPGLSDVLKGDLQPDGAPVALRDGGFHLLTAGTPGQHPGWLFREQRIGQVLARYREMFDLVIIDTPPILPVADALSLGRWVDGALMVIRYDVSRFPLVERARKKLIAAGIPILKTVVNGVKSSRFGSGYMYNYGGYGSGGGYGYGERTHVADDREPTPSGRDGRAATLDS